MKKGQEQRLEVDLNGGLWSPFRKRWEDHVPGAWERIANTFYEEEGPLEVISKFSSGKEFRLTVKVLPYRAEGLFIVGWGKDYAEVCEAMEVPLANAGSFLPWCKELGCPGVSLPIEINTQTFPAFMKILTSDVGHALAEDLNVWQKTRKKLRKRSS